MDYIVCNWFNLSGLVSEVHKFIGEGWEPLGGVAAVCHETDPRGDAVIEYLQAMVRRGSDHGEH